MSRELACGDLANNLANWSGPAPREAECPTMSQRRCQSPALALSHPIGRLHGLHGTWARLRGNASAQTRLSARIGWRNPHGARFGRGRTRHHTRGLGNLGVTGPGPPISSMRQGRHSQPVTTEGALRAQGSTSSRVGYGTWCPTHSAARKPLSAQGARRSLLRARGAGLGTGPRRHLC